MNADGLTYFIQTTSKSVRFLLACLIRKILSGGIDPKNLIWDLDEQGKEAHYLNLLYNKKLDEPLIKTLFKQSFSPYMIADCCHYEHIFNSYRYGCYRSPENHPRLYELQLNLEFFRESASCTQLDVLLGWPRDLAGIFFEYLETHLLPDNLLKLTKDLRFDDWGKPGGKPYWRESDGKVYFFRLDLGRRPKQCPFCHSSEIVDVIVGYPVFSRLKGNENLYGCCIEPACPPPAWHCNHCGLTIWNTSDLHNKYCK